MVLKSYFDGGNEADSTQYDVVTLASVSATTDQLRPFSQEWEAVLKKHKAPLHTTYLVSRKKKPFKDTDGRSPSENCVEAVTSICWNHRTVLDPRARVFLREEGALLYTSAVIQPEAAE